MARKEYQIESIPLLHFMLVKVILLTYIVSQSCHCGSPGDDAGRPSCIRSERIALLAIKAEINSTDVWLSSWKGDDCCSGWRGVSCNSATGHVVELDLRYPHRHNPEVPHLGPSRLHPSVSNLTRLKYLDLSMNNFQGALIPEYVASLKHLEYLNLSFAAFSGTIPHQLGSLSNLQFLDLQSIKSNSHYLVAPDLRWISHIASLRHLDLSGVDLHAAVDWLQHVSMLPSLSVLCLRSANLRRLASSVPNPNLTSLAVLDLSSNYFNSAIPQWVFNISSLVKLNLKKCGLLGDIPPAIEYFGKMQHLDLSYNVITGDIQKVLSNLSRLEYLNLYSNQISGEIPQSIGNISHLSYLDLADNGISGHIPETLGSIERLSFLGLFANQMSGSIPESIGSLKNLMFLSLTGNKITGSFPRSFGKLTQLEWLEISYNKISGGIPESFGNLSNLQVADMSCSNIGGRIPETIGKLRNLYHLDLRGNFLDGTIPRTMGNLCNLDYLDLSENGLTGSIAPFLDSLARRIDNKQSGHYNSASGLTRLILTKNRLNGTIPKVLGRLTSLITLDLSFNSFSGYMTEAHFTSIVNLSRLDLSFNSLEIKMRRNWIPPFNATRIRLCGCKVGPEFPAWLQSQKNLSDICLSEAAISGAVPAWFWDLLYFYPSSLNISHNSLSGRLPSSLKEYIFNAFDASYNSFEGPIPQLNPHELNYIHLSNNLFSGPIPQSFAAATSSLQFISLSHNSLNRAIPSFFCNMTGLQVLDLSSNELFGEIPQCWNNSLILSIIDLSQNSLSGQIPHSLGYLSELKSLHLRNNSLHGMIPSSLRGCKQLVTLDLGDNNLNGSIPSWIGEKLSRLRVLNLRLNRLDGIIPTELSNIPFLQVLDLAHNNLSGDVPHSLGKFSAMFGLPRIATSIGYDNYRFQFYLQAYSDYFYRESQLMSKKGTEYVYSSILSLVTSIDISSNNLIGNIPPELTNLSGLLFLNMSNNHFNGKIPDNIGALSQLQSLDLSVNNLSGNIPLSMAALSFLNQLNLSYNSLTGKLPLGTQLQSFDPSVYKGNPYLCGSPLPVDCPGDTLLHSTSRTDGEKDDKGDIDGSEMAWICDGFAPGFAVGLLVFTATLMIKQSIKTAYLQLIDSICDGLYAEATGSSVRLS